MKTILSVLFLLLTACAPSQHNEARYGVVRYAFGAPLDSAGPFREDQLVELRGEMQSLNALGPTFVETTEAQADVVIRPMDSSLRTDRCHNSVGCYTPGNDYIELDPAQARGYLQLRAACGHEMGHKLGMAHVCFYGGELPSCDVGVGESMMNEDIAYGDVLNAGAQGEPNGVPQDAPTHLDLAEFRRTHP